MNVPKKVTRGLFFLVFLTAFTYLSSCAPSTSSESTTNSEPTVPRPEVTTTETSSIFDVSASVNGEEIPVAVGDEDFYVIANDEFSIGVFFSPNNISTLSVEELDAWSDTVEIFTLLGFFDSLYQNDTTRFALFVTNESQEPIRVVWDETAIVDTDGAASGVIHEGVRFSEMNNSQSPTTIPPGARIEDYIGPTNRIDFVASEWQEYRLFTEDIEEGDVISIFLALEVGGENRNVNIEFEANSSLSVGPTEVEVFN